MGQAASLGGPPFVHASSAFAAAALIVPVLAARRGAQPPTAEHPAHHARHDARGSDGVSGVEARADAGARRLRAECHRLHPRLRAGADDDRVARDAAHRHAIPPVHRVNDFGAPLPCDRAVSPGAPARRRLSNRGVRRIADPRSAQRDRAGIRSRLRRLRRRLPASPAGRRSVPYGRTARRRGRHPCARLVSTARHLRRASFLWVHLFDPHDPYDPPADLKARFAAAPYDGEIAAVDRLVGRLHSIGAARHHRRHRRRSRRGARRSRRGDARRVPVRRALHVPLVIRVPGGGRGHADRHPRPPGRRRADAARGGGIAGSAGDAGGDADAVGPRGFAGSENHDRPVYAETEYPRRAFGWSPLAAWRNDRFLLVRAPKPELYDLVADPGATKNLAAARPRVLDGMSAELRDFIVRSTSPPRRSSAAARASKAGRSSAEVVRAKAGIQSSPDGSPRSATSAAAALRIAPASIPRIGSPLPTRCTRRSSPSKTAPFRRRSRCSRR